MTIEKAIENRKDTVKENKMRKYLVTNHATNEKIIVEANSVQEAAKKVGCRIKGSEVTDIGQPEISGIPIAKAIELLQGYVKPTKFAPHEDIDDAIELGIAALKRLQDRRATQSFHPEDLLPGETEE